MVDDPDAAQARMLLGLLHQEINEISGELEAAENRAIRPRTRGHLQRDRREYSLRQRLYEAYRLIDNLHRRFPETFDRSQMRTVGMRRREALPVRGRHG